MHHPGSYIAKRRKELGYTQQKLAEQLGLSFQAVSKWELGVSSPDISLLPQLAGVLRTSVDAIVGYPSRPSTHYEDKYRDPQFYWGIEPNSLCYEIMRLLPPVRPYRVLDIGCGEGKDAVFLARNGYDVTAFDIAEAGVEKARELAAHCRTEVNFFRADMLDFRPEETYDVIFSSGVLHYLPPEKRRPFFDRLKAHTAPGGLMAANVFVFKPFIGLAPDSEEAEIQAGPWYSGELAGYYHDWLLLKNDEIIFDCDSGGTPHKHCMDILIAQHPTA